MPDDGLTHMSVCWFLLSAGPQVPSRLVQVCWHGGSVPKVTRGSSQHQEGKPNAQAFFKPVLLSHLFKSHWAKHVTWWWGAWPDPDLDAGTYDKLRVFSMAVCHIRVYVYFNFFMYLILFLVNILWAQTLNKGKSGVDRKELHILRALGAKNFTNVISFNFVNLEWKDWAAGRVNNLSKVTVSRSHSRLITISKALKKKKKEWCR